MTLLTRNMNDAKDSYGIYVWVYWQNIWFGFIAYLLCQIEFISRSFVWDLHIAVRKENRENKETSVNCQNRLSNFALIG